MLNTILKPILKLLTLPIAVITLGIAWFFVSLMMIWLTTLIVGKFDIDGFWNYVWATIIVWLANILVDAVLRPHAARDSDAAASAAGLTGNDSGVPEPPPGDQRVSPYLLYEDAEAAIAYLRETFGFEERRRETGGAGRLHAELLLGRGRPRDAGQAGDGFSSAPTLGTMPAAMVHVYVDDVEALHARARPPGPKRPSSSWRRSGDRRFTAGDPEGQIWVFAQRVEYCRPGSTGRGR